MEKQTIEYEKVIFLGFSLNKEKKEKQKIIEKLKNNGTNELSDITHDWIYFLKNLKKCDDPSFLMWSLGLRGWGKTGFTFQNNNIIMKNDKDRFVQFLLVPDSLIENINKYCPEDQKGKFESIKGLREIKDYAIFVIDEGLIQANASNALTTEMKKLEGFLSNSRHYDVIFMINSINYKILRTIRGIIDIKVYKHLPELFYIEYGREDPILQEYKDSIKTLKETEGLMFSGFKFFEKTGKFNLDYLENCSWYNKEISKHMKDSNPDYYYEGFLNTWEENRKLAKEIIKKIGHKYRKKNGYKLFKSWFYNRYKEKFYDNESSLRDIYDLYIYFLDEGYYERIKQEKKALEIINLVYKKFKFQYHPELIFNILRKEKKWRNKDRDFEIYQKRKNGEILEDIAEQYNDLNSAQAISNIEMKVAGAFNYYKGKLFEKKVYNFFQDQDTYEFVELDGTPGKADLKIYDEENNGLYIISLKCEDIESNVRTYYPKELEPELRLAYYCFNFEKYDFVYLLLWSFNSHNDTFKIENVDFGNPKPITFNY